MKSHSPLNQPFLKLSQISKVVPSKSQILQVGNSGANKSINPNKLLLPLFARLSTSPVRVTEVARGFPTSLLSKWNGITFQMTHIAGGIFGEVQIRSRQAAFLSGELVAWLSTSRAFVAEVAHEIPAPPYFTRIV
jgi:hypothetical protein